MLLNCFNEELCSLGLGLDSIKAKELTFISVGRGKTVQFVSKFGPLYVEIIT